MSLLAERMRASDGSARIVDSWNSLCARFNPVIAIIAAWAVLTVPLVFFRGYNSDEGVAVTIARSAVEDGYWLTPHMFNVRFIERPTLVSWIIAAISAPFGHVSQITARVPIILFLLVGCLLIYSLLRKIGASIPAALLGTALFMACPIVMRGYVMITADMPLAVLLFLAFVLWWNGYAKGAISLGRWIAIGTVLAFAGLMKGPEPIGYFALGIGLFVLASRSWRQIPGLALAGLICVIPLALWYPAVYRPGDEAVWAAFMRIRPGNVFYGPTEESFKLLTETLPAMLFAAAFLISQAFRDRNPVSPPAFLPAIACYAFTAAPAVLFWPGGSTARYFFPMFLPLAVLGGLGYDLLSPRRPHIVAPILILTAGLLTYAFVYSVVASPLMPMRFRQSKIEAEQVTALVQEMPATIYTTGVTALNVLPYIPGRILKVKPSELETLLGPAWIIIPTGEAKDLLSRRQGLRVVMPMGDREQWRLLRLDNDNV